MQSIYDNGTIVLGTVKKIKKYLINNKEVVEDFDNIMEDLEDLHDDDIVAINYDLGMGYTMDYWTKLDKLRGF